MRALGLVVALFALEARAATEQQIALDALADVIVVTGSMVFGLAAATHEAMGGDLILAVNCMLATLNTAIAVVAAGFIATDHSGRAPVPLVAFTAMHAGLALWNAVAPWLGLPNEAPAPAIISGRDARGRKWTGLAVRLSVF